MGVGRIISKKTNSVIFVNNWSYYQLIPMFRFTAWKIYWLIDWLKYISSHSHIQRLTLHDQLLAIGPAQSSYRFLEINWLRHFLPTSPLLRTWLSRSLSFSHSRLASLYSHQIVVISDQMTSLGALYPFTSEHLVERIATQMKIHIDLQTLYQLLTE